MQNKDEKIYCKNGGCGAKLGANVLSHILEKIDQSNDSNLLVGFDSSDDAAVYKINDNLAIVQTLDFFPPMVNDPYIFGQIAATNSLSDIYAMGAEFKTALNIVCFPQNEDLNILGKIIKGGSDKVTEAGGNLVGGHSINDDTIKYGLSVFGTVDPEKIYRNNKSQIGDALVLTKPLGIGIITSANNIGQASNEAFQNAVLNMTTLNKAACEISKDFSVNACTDVTGFGLITHLIEMLQGFKSKTAAELYSDSIPYITEAYDYAKDFYITEAGQRNRNFASNSIKFEIDDFAIEEIVFDPQTSGGLLFSLPKNQANSFVKELNKQYPCASVIGQVIADTKYKVRVK